MLLLYYWHHLPSPFHCFILELKTYLFRKTYHPPRSVSVCRTDLMAVDRFLALFAHRFLCFSSIVFCFRYSCVRQTKLASFLVNFWANEKIVIN